MSVSIAKSLTVSLIFAVLVMHVLTGCEHIGPGTIPVDRFDYNSTIGDSWKQQTLLNVVKLRYMDLPIFIDVASIVSGYSMQTGGTVSGTVSSEKAIQGNFLAGSAQAVYTDRPTITYVPQTGQKFLKALITPIDPKNIFFMLQSGYPADFLLSLTVESINGVRNRSFAGGVLREADPEFVRALQLMREVQAAGAIAMRVEQDKASGSTAVLLFRRDDIPPEIAEKGAEVRRLLRLPLDQQKFKLVYSPMPGAEGELAVNSRSMLQIMLAFSSYLDVPEEHLKDHSATPAFENAAAGEKRAKLRIHCGSNKPASSFVAVYYRDHWFWIENGDWQTKRALSAIMFMFTITETSSDEKLPLITIPAQ